MQRCQYDIKGFINSSKTADADKAIYRKMHNEALEFLEKGQKFLAKKENLCPMDSRENYTQSVTGSTLHRGIYCPSPIWDIVVGNNKRGKLLIRETKRSNVSHRYVFSKDSVLLRVENIYRGETAGTEYFQQCGAIRYGFTIDNTGKIYAVSEEIYRDSVLERYTIVYFYFLNAAYVALKTHSESYQRDEQGLYACDIIDCDYPIGYIDRQSYRFVRDNGYLSSYCVIQNNEIASQEFMIKSKIKA